jgi:FdhE protein
MTTLQELEKRNPEWRPWLAQVGEVLAQLGDPAWEAAVPARMAARGSNAPLLAGLPASLPIPLLHACRRRWAGAIPKDWSRGYCPVCGAWPGFAEVCGVERTRFLRCVRCGSAWQAHGLWCPYCEARDHAVLGSLVPEQGAPAWAIEVCNACRGYLKAFTRLKVSPPEQTLLDDIASVELDLAAAGRGYRRPEGAGYSLHDAG